MELKQQTISCSVIIPSLKKAPDITTLKFIPSVIKDVVISREFGLGKARNWGAKQAKGDILVFCDGDLKLDPKIWQHLLSIKRGQVIMYAIIKRPCSRVMAVTKSDFQKIGGFDESIFFTGEDTDFQLRAMDFGFQILLLPRNLITHIDHNHIWEKDHRAAYKAESERMKLYTRYGERYDPFRRRIISATIVCFKKLRFDLLLIKYASFLYHILRNIV